MHPAGCTASVEESSNIGEDAFPLTDNRCQSDTLPLSEPEDLEFDHSEGITENSIDPENNVTQETTVKFVETPKDHCSSQPVRKRIKPRWINSGNLLCRSKIIKIQIPYLNIELAANICCKRETCQLWKEDLAAHWIV